VMDIALAALLQLTSMTNHTLALARRESEHENGRTYGASY